MRRFASLAFILSTVGACGLPTSYEVQVEEPMRAHELEQVQEAAANWTAKVPELHLKVVAAHGGCALSATLYEGCITIEAANETRVDGIVDKPGDWGGVDSRIGPAPRAYASDITYDDAHNPTENGRIIRHELGHAFGLWHYGPGTIMDQDWRTWTFIVTDEDVKKFRSIR